MPEDIKKYRKELRKWYKEVKSNSKCAFCGEITYLQFHHIDPWSKVETVSQMVHKCYPQENIQLEMNKCIVLCRRCHCKEHNRMKRESGNVI